MYNNGCCKINCYEMLDTKGYSIETVVRLQEESLPPDECEKLLNMLEIIYG